MDIKVGSFGWAMELLKAGDKLQRTGWNGRGMWVALMPGFFIDEDNINERTRKHLPDHLGKLQCGGYFVIWTAQKTWQPGWKPTYLDLFANDWRVVDADGAPIFLCKTCGTRMERALPGSGVWGCRPCGML